VLLDELLETTLSRIELEVTNETLAKKWSHEERDALRDFVDRATPLFGQITWQDENLTVSTIVNEDASMRMIRKAANECLKRVKARFSLGELLAD
jgi:hypothetical protein